MNGCRQNLHADAPHGPFAFVLSLTKWEGRRFSGGETLLLQPQVLDYWRRFDSGVGTEMPQLVSGAAAQWLPCWRWGRADAGVSSTCCTLP